MSDSLLRPSPQKSQTLFGAHSAVARLRCTVVGNNSRSCNAAAAADSSATSTPSSGIKSIPVTNTTYTFVILPFVARFRRRMIRERPCTSILRKRDGAYNTPTRNTGLDVCVNNKPPRPAASRRRGLRERLGRRPSALLEKRHGADWRKKGDEWLSSRLTSVWANRLSQQTQCDARPVRCLFKRLMGGKQPQIIPPHFSSNSCTLFSCLSECPLFLEFIATRYRS